MNPFNVLEIPPDASPEDIKAAYHRLAKRWHPDRFSGDEKAEAEARFRELAEAFSILKDPARREALQQQLLRPVPAAAAREKDVAQERTPEDWAAMARTAFDEGKTDQARALIHYAIRLDGQQFKYHTLLASILEQDGGDLRAAVKALETAVRLAPKDVETHLRLAQHFQTLGLTARAQGHLQLAREIAPNHPKLRQFEKRARGNASAGAGEKKGAPPEPQGVIDQLRNLLGRWTGKG